MESNKLSHSAKR